MNDARVFARRGLTQLGACVGDVFTCVQTKLGDQRCLDRGAVKCTRKMSALADEKAGFSPTSAKPCGDLTFGDLLAPAGIGYASLETECQADGTVLDNAPAIAQCLVDKYLREVGRLFALTQPRAEELIDFVGVEALPELELPDFGGDGLGIDDLGTARAVAKCSSAIVRRGIRLATSQLRGLLKCIDGVFTCVQTKDADVRCRAKAADVCATVLAALDDEETAVGREVETKCSSTAVPLGSLQLQIGAYFDAVVPECSSVQVLALDSIADYQRCLTRQHRCRVEELVRFAAPRADELLRFLLDRPLRSEFCTP